MDDTISRQAAIDIERNATVDTNPSHFEAHQKFTQFMDDAEVSSFGRWQWSNGFNTALTAVGIDLKKLPSAQPESCKDTVSRQRLLSDLKELVAAWKKYPVMAEQIKGVEAAIGYVEAIPSAQPERKNGKWNTYYHSDIDFSHSCNQCGYSAPYQMIGGEVFQKKWNFCPNCGADMRGEKDD